MDNGSGSGKPGRFGRRRVGPTLTVGLAVVAVAALVIVWVTTQRAGRTDPGLPASATVCGWDLSAAGGVQANRDYLTSTVQWLTEHPGQTPPAPTSPYWRGPCPTPSGPPIGPPEDEHDSPDEAVGS